MDEYTGSVFGQFRGVGDPLEDHHEHQVAEQRHHEEQFRDQHKEHTAYLAKVPGGKHKTMKRKQVCVKAIQHKYEKNRKVEEDSQHTCTPKKVKHYIPIVEK